jgi:hypothetical protein
LKMSSVAAGINHPVAGCRAVHWRNYADHWDVSPRH